MIWTSKLRPDWVDWDVYQRVRVKMEPIERVAKASWLTPEQVMRWVERMTVFLIAVASKDADAKKGETGEQRYSQELASERLAYLAELAMESFELSCGAKTEIRRAGGQGEPKVTTKVSFGDVKYLMAAGRLLEMGRKMLPPRQSRMFIGNGSAEGAEVEWVPDDRYESFSAAALQISPQEEQEIKQRYFEAQARQEKAQQESAAKKQERTAAIALAGKGALPSKPTQAELEARELAEAMANDGKNHPNRQYSGALP